MKDKTLTEILDSFKQPFDDYLESKPVYSKGSKSGSVDYIAWHELCNILDLYAPGWEWDVQFHSNNGRTVIVGKLTIHGSDGSLTRCGTGNEVDDECSGYGDPVSNAEAMSMRRACAKFGIGRYLWSKEKPQSQQYQKQNYQQQSSQVKKPVTPAKPAPQPKQLWDMWKSLQDAIVWALTIIPDANPEFLRSYYDQNRPEGDKNERGQWWVNTINKFQQSGEFERK